MIIILCGALGAFFGWRSAVRQDGNRKDIAQYMIAFGIAGLLIGLFISIFVARQM